MSKNLGNEKTSGKQSQITNLKKITNEKRT
jgi:hypothetical protein